MQIHKIEKRLTKINRLIELFKVDGMLSQIEKDILLDYVRKLYEDLMFDDLKSGGKVKESIKKDNPKIAPQKIEKVEEQSVNIVQQESQIEKEVSVEKEVVVAEPTSVEIKKVVEEAAPSKEFDELFIYDEVIDLSGKLSMSKIDDINKVIGINERIFTIKELFGGDNEVYSNTIKTLNSSNDFDAAQAFLVKEIIEKYGWNQEENIKKAQNFIKIVRRLFV